MYCGEGFHTQPLWHHYTPPTKHGPILQILFKEAKGPCLGPIENHLTLANINPTFISSPNLPYINPKATAYHPRVTLYQPQTYLLSSRKQFYITPESPYTNPKPTSCRPQTYLIPAQNLPYANPIWEFPKIRGLNIDPK